jgi:hypothetical protein
VPRVVLREAWDTTIGRPPPDVFAVLIDLETYLSRWARGPTGVQRVTPGPLGTGTRFEVIARVGPLRVRSPYVVTGFVLDEVFAGTGVAGPFRFEEEYRLAAGSTSGASAETLLHYEIAAVPRGALGVVSGFLVASSAG